MEQNIDHILQVLNLYESFLPHKIENSWIKTTRYYSDMIWLRYSQVFVVPLLLITLYRYFYPLQNIQKYENKKNFDKTKGYYFVYFMSFYAYYYYAFDIFLTVLEGNYFQMSKMRFGFLAHHLVSVPLLHNINKMNYIPWWVLSIGAWHGLLLSFPFVEVLNYPYGLFLFICHYQIYQKPYNTMPLFQNIRKIYPTLYIALLIFLYNECKNILPLLS